MQTSWIRIFVWTRFPGDLYAHWRVRGTDHGVCLFPPTGLSSMTGKKQQPPSWCALPRALSVTAEDPQVLRNGRRRRPARRTQAPRSKDMREMVNYTQRHKGVWLMIWLIKQITNENLHRELYSAFCGDLNGKEIQQRGDVCTRAADSLCWTEETNATLSSNYTPIKS